MTTDGAPEAERGGPEPPPAASPSRYRHMIEIVQGDIDFMGHVNNAVYLTWVQEAVTAHWRSVAPASALARHLWIALRHDIRYRRPTFMGDRLVVSSVIERISGARAFFRITIERGGELIAETSSSWCSVDASSHKPLRLPPLLIRLFGFDVALAPWAT